MAHDIRAADGDRHPSGPSGRNDRDDRDDREQRLPLATKAIFATGDLANNLALSSLSLVYLIFLTDVAGLRPALAGAVVWIARVIDGITDPTMGRITDRTRSRWGRRRPYLLAGALPFGLFFGLLWITPFDAQIPMFVYYAGIYIGLSLAATVVSVPYMALIPEMARGYDERTSLNTWRTFAAMTGVILAAGLQPAAVALGGNAAAWATVGAVAAFALVLPWLPVAAVSRERAIVAATVPVSLSRDLLDLLGHAHYRRLSALYIASRVALDVAGASLVYFMTYAIGRPEDFFPAIVCLMVAAAASLPIWMTVARGHEKHDVFVIGTAWWVAWLVVIAFATPEWPRWMIFVITGAVGAGYAVADLMPWAMVGEVIDEDELRSGQRREGLYNGTFTFLRKLGGATAILLAGLVLDLAGYVPKAQDQPADALLAIRMLTALVPGLCLATAIAFAWRYPLDRRRHDEILEALRERESRARA